MATGLWMDTGATRWWFDSGALSLDFAHTGPPEHEQFLAPDDLGAWLLERFEQLGDEATERDLSDAIGLRSAIQRIAHAQVEAADARADDVDTVNLFAATPDVPPALDGGHRQAGRSRVRVGQALATIARDAVTLFGGNTEGRIRSCAAADCDLVFYDESRTNNRRWCSMQRCGNRAKVRAFRSKPS
jgi:predicted RNA-binding Zn ribbon-like protein